MVKYQYPHNSEKEEKLLKRFGYPAFLEKMFAMKKWRKYYISAFKRAIAVFLEKYTHIAFKGHIELPDEFGFNEKLAIPRGNNIDGIFYSSSYEINFQDLPNQIKTLVFSFRNILESYFATEVNVTAASCWRNNHIPSSILDKNGEIISNAFHQDLVFDQYNLQLFILLHDTELKHGPFEYLEPYTQMHEMEYYRKRNRKKALSSSQKLTGKRGDFMLFTTGLSLHKAGVPDINEHRDIISIAFFPSYTNIGTPFSELV